MKRNTLSFLGVTIILLLMYNFTFAQSGQKWSTGLNTITTGEALGTLNNQPLQFKVNNALALQINPGGSVSLNYLSNNGNGMVTYNISGKLIPFVFPNDTTKVLLGNGTWGNIPIPNDYWHLNNNNLYTLTSGNVGIGTNNPQFKLDVDGDVRITENLYVGGGIIITDKVNAASEVNTGKINATTELKSAALRVDSIIMDSTKAIYGQANFTDDVKLANKLRVDGDVQINGNFKTAGNITFAGNKTIGYIPASGGNSEILYYSSDPSQNINLCFQPTVTLNQFTGLIQSKGSNGGDLNVMSMGYNGTNSIIDIATNGIISNQDPGLLINNFCGRNVSICTGTGGNVQLTSTGKVGIGVFPSTSAKLEVLGDVRISNLAPSSGINIVQVGTNGILSGLPLSNISFWQQSGNDIFSTNSGKVGIGTSTPTSKLQINAPSSDGLIVSTNSTSGGNYCFKGIVDNTNTKAISIYNGATENFLVKGDGKVWAREVTVSLTLPLGDFVFDKDYKLMPLKELENYLIQNHHLPKIPSAKEVNESGLNVGEFQNLLLQKVEELSLYIIQLEKRINELEK